MRTLTWRWRCRSGQRLLEDRRHDEGRNTEREKDGADEPAHGLVLVDDRSLESSLLFGNLEQRFLEFAECAELLLDVPELREALFDLIGSSHQIEMAALEFGFHRDERLEHRFDDALLDRVRGLRL